MNSNSRMQPYQNLRPQTRDAPASQFLSQVHTRPTRPTSRILTTVASAPMKVYVLVVTFGEGVRAGARGGFPLASLALALALAPALAPAPAPAPLEAQTLLSAGSLEGPAAGQRRRLERVPLAAKHSRQPHSPLLLLVVELGLGR